MGSLYEAETIKKLKRVFGVSYFIQGTNSIATLPINNFIKYVLQLGDAGGQLFSSMMAIGWVIKPLWGFISDRVPLFGYRRKSWFVLMASVSFVSWLCSGLVTMAGFQEAWIYFLLFNLALAGYAFVDVVGDGIMVENGQRMKKIGSFVTFQWTMLAISSALAGIFSGWFSDQIKSGDLEYWMIFMITGIFPLITALVGFYNIPEEKIISSNKKKSEIFYVQIAKKIALWFCKFEKPKTNSRIGLFVLIFSYIGLFLLIYWLTSSILIFLIALYIISRFGANILHIAKENRTLTVLMLFIIFWNFSPSLGYVQWSYLEKVRGISQTSFGILQAVDGIIFLISIMFYKFLIKKYKNIEWHQYLYAVIVLGALSFPISFFMYLNPDHQWWDIVMIFAFPDSWFSWIPVVSGWTRYEWFRLISSSILQFAAIFAFLIPLTIAGEGVKLASAGTSYAFLMSVSNATNMFGGTVGAGLYKIFQVEEGTAKFSYWVSKFSGSWMDISGLIDERTLILQMFVWISLIFTLLAIPFIYILKKEFKSKNIKVHLSS